jgi:hypothetical protein
MARPTVLHAGFLIPNAGDVASPKMAEPDRVDFNTLGNARFGVITGCLVTVSGATATNTEGIAIVDGKLVPMLGGQSASLGSAGSQDRYDLLVVNSGGNLKIVPGSPAQSPLFPDPPTDVTVLAAVFCPAGAGSYVDNVIDKRKMLSDALLTKRAALDPLVANRNGSGDMFRITGDGATSWADDTVLRRISAKTLQVTENLNVEGDLHVGDAITAQSLYAEGKVRGSNLQQGFNLPASANQGDLFQSDAGALLIWQGTAWEEIATVKSSIPVGSVITSLIAPAGMSAGWVALAGQVIQEDVYATPFAIPALAPYIVVGGTAPHRSMTLPDARGRMLMGALSGAAAAKMDGSNSLAVLLANMPPHKHDVKTTPTPLWPPTVRIGPAGRHGHTTQRGGNHIHEVADPGHRHLGAEAPAGGAFVALSWNGQNKIDAYFNDRSHTYSVEAADWTAHALTGIRISSLSSEHDHIIDPVDDHYHTVSIDPLLPHEHDVTESEKGSGQPISYTPLHMTVYVYLRV